MKSFSAIFLLIIGVACNSEEVKYRNESNAEFEDSFNQEVDSITEIQTDSFSEIKSTEYLVPGYYLGRLSTSHDVIVEFLFNSRDSNALQLPQMTAKVH